MTEQEYERAIEAIRAKLRRYTAKKIALEREIHELAIQKILLINERRDLKRRFDNASEKA